jgi:hypothetical protein
MRNEATLLSVVLLGCSEPVCDLCSTSTIVYGTLTKTGTPVPNASVTVTPFQNSCSGNAAAGPDGPLPTATDGRYRVSIRSLYGPFTACIRVQVFDIGPPSNPTVMVEGATVRFLDDFGGNLKHDSVLVDVTVP